MSKRAEKRATKLRTSTDYLGRRNKANNLFSPEALAAIERYPPLASIPASNHVLMCARNLDALPETHRALALDWLALQDSDVLAALAQMPPMPDRASRLSTDAQLAGLIEAIERHSTPFNLAAFTAEREAQIREAVTDETDKPAA